jgi:hypothetical protein
MPLANRKQTPQLCSQAVSQVSILIVARHHPDCRATRAVAAGAEEPSTGLLVALTWVSQAATGCPPAAPFQTAHAADRFGERSAFAGSAACNGRRATWWRAWVATEGRRLPQSHGDDGGGPAGAAIVIPVLVAVPVLALVG